MDKIRVVIAEDSHLTAEIIRSLLVRDPGIEVVGMASNGKEALRLIETLKPDIVTLDIDMPVMDGMEATKQIMAHFPTPILVISSIIFSRSDHKVFEVISYGALDAMDKESFFKGEEVDEKVVSAFIEKVKFLAGIPVVHHPLAKMEKVVFEEMPKLGLPTKSAGGGVVGIVASTGGPIIVARILKLLPKDYPVPIVIVVHMAEGFVEGFAEWLTSQTCLNVKIGENGEELKAGTAYIAPGGLQSRVTEDRRMRTYKEAEVCGMAPSGTVLLESIAKSYGKSACGVVLTGMGRDGADGLKMIRDSDGLTLVQDEESSVVFGMPKAAIDEGAADHILMPEEIAKKLISWGEGNSRG